MSNSGLMERTEQIVNLTVPGNQTLDAKVRQLVEAEYLRRLAQYRRSDLALARKYGMTFDEFLAQHISHQHGYSWEVEQDAMAWESAIGGITTMDRQLRELREFND